MSPAHALRVSTTAIVRNLIFFSLLELLIFFVAEFSGAVLLHILQRVPAKAREQVRGIHAVAPGALEPESFAMTVGATSSFTVRNMASTTYR